MTRELKALASSIKRMEQMQERYFVIERIVTIRDRRRLMELIQRSMMT